MLQRVCSVVDNSWRQSVVRTKKWRSEPCDVNVTISASCDWSVEIFTTSLKCQESYLTLRNVTLQITRDFFRLHNTFSIISIMLPPHQPRVFARLARWQLLQCASFLHPSFFSPTGNAFIATLISGRKAILIGTSFDKNAVCQKLSEQLSATRLD